MMVPWEDRPGCLETLLIEAVYDARPDLARCVDVYAACTHTDVWNEIEQSKMKLQSLISAICKSDPNTALSYAWSRAENIIPLDRSCFDRIAEFLRNFDTRSLDRYPTAEAFASAKSLLPQGWARTVVEQLGVDQLAWRAKEFYEIGVVFSQR